MTAAEGIIQVEQGKHGWCPHCRATFSLILDSKNRIPCPLCGHARDDMLMQIEAHRFWCRKCDITFGDLSETGALPCCHNCMEGTISVLKHLLGKASYQYNFPPDSGWCPYCKTDFLITFDRKDPESFFLCPTCGRGRDDMLVQLSPYRFWCRECGLKFDVSPEETPWCPNQHEE